MTLVGSRRRTWLRSKRSTELRRCGATHDSRGVVGVEGDPCPTLPVTSRIRRLGLLPRRLCRYVAKSIYQSATNTRNETIPLSVPFENQKTTGNPKSGQKRKTPFKKKQKRLLVKTAEVASGGVRQPSAASSERANLGPGSLEPQGRCGKKYYNLRVRRTDARARKKDPLDPLYSRHRRRHTKQGRRRG